MIASPARDSLDVSRETAERLDRFAALVAHWTARINLVSRASLAEIHTRHILDSAQLFDLAPAGWRHWADLGSGGGFPGIVIAILARDRCPGARVTLVESDQRKAAFLRTAVRELDLPADVRAARAGDLPPLAADVLSARALAPLADLLPLALCHLAPGGIALFPKGRRAGEEVAAARRNWRFEAESLPSLTDPEARILRIGGIARA